MVGGLVSAFYVSLAGYLGFAFFTVAKLATRAYGSELFV